MMRTYNAAVHNAVGNHPSVSTAIEHDASRGPLFFDNLAIEPAYFALLHNETQDAASIFEFRGPGIWESHTMFLPSCRGRKGVIAAKMMMAEMFTIHDADILWGQTPVDNRAARLFNKWIGATERGRGVHSVAGDVVYFRVDRATWLSDHWDHTV